MTNLDNSVPYLVSVVAIENNTPGVPPSEIVSPKWLMKPQTVDFWWEAVNQLPTMQ